VEFIVTPGGEFYFLEMNTRLQVEHPVTEFITGLDIVKLQFAIAAGDALPIPQADVTRRGHAIECRLYAEDPRNNFLPAVGPVLQFIPPEGPGIRVDSGVRTGDSITIHYDPLIAKIIVYDTTRAEAIRRMQMALANTVVLGTATNLPFLRALLNHPAFLAGEVDTGFVDTHPNDLLPDVPDLPDAALIVAALHDSRKMNAITGVVYDPWQRADGFRAGQQQG
jgi:acetyl/propionyl-CoA carboxylase alpha subunit